jgi:hypothetical protein
VTNEQLKEAIAIEATRRWKERGVHFIETLANIAVELTQEGWAPPEVVDPDEQWAHQYTKQLFDHLHPVNPGRAYDYFLDAIKRGRGFAMQEQTK